MHLDEIFFQCLVPYDLKTVIKNKKLYFKAHEGETSSTDALKLFIFTDMPMPQLTSDKLAEEMIKIRANIPIILCTGFSKFISEKKASEIGIKAMALKPLAKEDFSKT